MSEVQSLSSDAGSQTQVLWEQAKLDSRTDLKPEVVGGFKLVSLIVIGFIFVVMRPYNVFIGGFSSLLCINPSLPYPCPNKSSLEAEQLSRKGCQD